MSGILFLIVRLSDCQIFGLPAPCKALYFCLLGEVCFALSIRYQFYQFFLEGYLFLIFTIFLLIYILLLISYMYYKGGFLKVGGILFLIDRTDN